MKHGKTAKDRIIDREVAKLERRQLESRSRRALHLSSLLTIRPPR